MVIITFLRLFCQLHQGRVYEEASRQLPTREPPCLMGEKLK